MVLFIRQKVHNPLDLKSSFAHGSSENQTLINESPEGVGKNPQYL